MAPLNPVTTLGLAYSRYGNRPFGIRQSDRLLHLYLIGQTGTGKSTLLSNMARQDAKTGTGYCLIDPHGDLAVSLRETAPSDTLYWDIANPGCPFGYNPLTPISRKYRPLLASGLIETLRKQWADAWGARMEHLLRYAILALLEQPQADIRDIMRLFVETEFRKSVVANIQDPQVLQFWAREFPNMNYKTAIDGVAPIANKLGAFLAHPLVRKAICEPEESLRFRRIMDEGHGLIVNLSKGRLGSDMTNILGGLIVSSILHAALTREDQPASERRPFMLYVDEFHAFTTAAFANLMAEIRKYGIGVTLAQQYTVQTEADVLEAILGNVGSLIAFRLGPLDAPLFGRQLGDVPVADLVNLPNYQATVQLMVDGQKTKPFTAWTAPPEEQSDRYSAS